MDEGGGLQNRWLTPTWVRIPPAVPHIMPNVTSEEVKRLQRETGCGAVEAKTTLVKRSLEEEREYYLNLVLNGHSAFLQTKSQRIKQLEKALYWLLKNCDLKTKNRCV